MVASSSSTPTSTPNKKRGDSQRWLPRLFHRSGSQADIISTHMDDRQGDTEFFASLESNTTLAFFRRDELQVGELIGKGTFTSIHAVVGILDSDLLSEDDEETCNTPPTITTTEEECRTRRSEFQASLCSRQQPRYAVKQLTAATLQDPKTLTRAARELVNDAKYLSKLADHPNIVTLRGLTLDAFGNNYLAHRFDDFFLIRDVVAPRTLSDKIYRDWKCHDDEEEPNEDLIPMKANYAFQIAKALRYCHENGVLYRDLKPANIGFSLQDSHCVQLLEFGLARDLPQQTPYSSAPYRMTLAGTRRYLASEVLRSGEYTLKSDVYSWAMVYYEMCTERKPYWGLTATQHQYYVCEHGDRPSLDDYYLPETIDEILTQSWHPKLAKRWSMKKVCQEMQNFLMQLDITYYQQEEGDFLFDVDPTPIHVESWTEEFGEQVLWWEEEVAAPGIVVDCEYEDTEMKPKSDGSRRASLSSVRTPHRRRASGDGTPIHNSRRASLSSVRTPNRRMSSGRRASGDGTPNRRASLSSVRTPNRRRASLASMSSFKTPPSRRASLSSVQPVTPRKVISEAA